MWWWAAAVLVMAAATRRVEAPWSSSSVRAAVILPAHQGQEMSLGRVRPVLRLAAQEATRRHLRPRGWIHFQEHDDQCEAVYAQYISGVAQQGANVFFGPSCEYCVAAVGRMLRFWKTPLLTPGALTFDFTKNKTSSDSEYHLLIRVGLLSFEPMADCLVKIIKTYDWQHVMLVYDKDGCRDIAGKHTCKLMMETLVDQLKRSKIHYGSYEIEKNKHLSLEENLRREISNLYSIVVVCADPKTVREILLVAEELKMVDSGEYVFFNLELHNWQVNHKPWFMPNETQERNERAKKAYTALLTVTARTPDNMAYKNFSDE